MYVDIYLRIFGYILVYAHIRFNNIVIRSVSCSFLLHIKYEIINYININYININLLQKERECPESGGEGVPSEKGGSNTGGNYDRMETVCSY